MIRIKEVINVLENWASPAYQESYDNCGLLTGNSADEVKGTMVCLDATEDVLDEAIKENCNLIIAHHPIVFSGLKKITGRNYVERVIIKAIKNNLALYALHTNLDNIETGVNMRLCHQLGLTNAKILLTKQGTLKKLVTFTPIAQAEKVRTALFEAGAGNISNYSECSFNVEGKGTFKPEAEANPVIGEKLIRHTESEVRTEVIFEAHKEYQVLKALFESHPYEEVAYDIYALTNSHQQTGSGMIALLEDEMDEIAFLNMVKTKLNCSALKHTRLCHKKVRKVAVCGGSGFFLLPQAIAAGADAFITSDIKYHQFFDADGSILLIDAGHYETEQFTMMLIKDLLIKNFTTFAIRLTKVDTNPVKYI